MYCIKDRTRGLCDLDLQTGIIAKTIIHAGALSIRASLTPRACALQDSHQHMRTKSKKERARQQLETGAGMSMHLYVK